MKKRESTDWLAIITVVLLTSVQAALVFYFRPRIEARIDALESHTCPVVEEPAPLDLPTPRFPVGVVR